MVQSIKVKQKECHCNPPRWHIDSNQIGTCLNCGGVKQFKDNKELDIAIKKRRYRTYDVKNRIPNDVLEEIKYSL